MAGGVYLWSQTQATNASADPTVNWAEGQAPSSINDSARNMMASVAKWRDDIAGAIATSGTSTAYTVTSNQSFDTLAHMNGQLIAFTPHTTNTGTTTLNVDSLGAKPVRSAPNVEIPSGTLIQGTPYTVVYSNSDSAFYLHNFFGNPYNIPIGGSIEYWGSTAPNSSFILPYGQAISRTTYSAFFALVGVTFGVGDGSTTFNVPDLRGRTTACPDNMGGGSDPNRLTSGALAAVRNSIGGAGGESGHTLTQSELPTSIGTTPATAIAGGTFTYDVTPHTNGSAGGFTAVGPGQIAQTGLPSVVQVSNSTLGSMNVTNSSGGNAHNVMQPTILCYRILRII